MDRHAVHTLAAGQNGLVAWWQLQRAGWSDGMIQHRLDTHRWRAVHRGVYALTNTPLTRRQMWIAATLTAPGSYLSHASGGACWEFRPWVGGFEIVTRAGRGGPRRHGDLLVCRLPLPAEDTTRHDGIPITTGARTLLDLAPHLTDRQLGRAFREALRLEATTHRELAGTLARSRKRRGVSRVTDLTTRYAKLAYRRTRSNAEARALEVLADAVLSPPLINHRIAGEEADLLWPERRLIVEIDGPDFHRFADEDARKQRAWEDAGWTVRRIQSDDVYDRPERLVALARPNGP